MCLLSAKRRVHEVQNRSHDHEALGSYQVAPADWRWHDGPIEQILTNTGDELFEAVIYQLP